MEQAELEDVIKGAGGRENALAYAPELLEKVNRMEAHASLRGMLNQFRAAKQPGDLRGRVLEVNFADAFLARGIVLSEAVKQGQSGDIDFRWDTQAGRLFFELKLLGEQLAIRESEREQAKSCELFHHDVDDRIDVGRLQRDIFAKSTIAKFNPMLEAGSFNLLAIDVSELQLGMVDECDCVHAVCGASGARRLFDEPMIRSEVVGALEPARDLRPVEQDWVKRFHPEPTLQPHPRTYLHAVVFLFRRPEERAALSYDFSSCIVWNESLVARDVASSLQLAIYNVLPKLT